MELGRCARRRALALSLGLAVAGCVGTHPGGGVAPPPPNDAAVPGDGGEDAAEAAAAPGDGGEDAADAADGEVGGTTGVQLFQILDDMEGGNPNLPTPVGLASWYVNSPQSGGLTAGAEWAHVAPDPPRDNSRIAQHVVVTDPSGADLRVDFHSPAFPSTSYPNLSAYAGVAFWSRGHSSSGALLVAIQDDTRAAGSKAYAEARASAQPWFEHATTLTEEWRRHILLFDDFRQPGQTDSRLRTEAVWSIHVLAALDGSGGDVWIDDLALLCRGACPPPSWNLAMSATGLDDASLMWTPEDPSSPGTGCAVLSALSMAPLSDLRADPLEKVILRVRIPVTVPPSVPLWAWRIQNAVTGVAVPPAALDDGWTTVAVPLTEPGEYLIGAHSHYPGINVCGVQATATVH